MAHELDSATRRQARTFLLDEILTELSQTGSPDLQPLLRALRDPDRVPHRQIARWLTNNDHPISNGAVYEYRNRNRLGLWLALSGVVIEDA